jgi:hypothetical protein
LETNYERVSAIKTATGYNWGSSVSWQVLLADATGDGVVIRAGPDGAVFVYPYNAWMARLVPLTC